MRKIDTSKLIDAETMLTEKYGAPGMKIHCEFEEKACAYYYGDDDTARQQVTVSTLISNIQH